MVLGRRKRDKERHCGARGVSDPRERAPHSLIFSRQYVVGHADRSRPRRASLFFSGSATRRSPVLLAAEFKVTNLNPCMERYTALGAQLRQSAAGAR